MTLCIAAACRHEGQSAVVTCADWQITAPGFAAEDYYKLRHYPNATIMISGDLGAVDDNEFVALHEGQYSIYTSVPQMARAEKIRSGSARGDLAPALITAVDGDTLIGTFE